MNAGIPAGLVLVVVTSIVGCASGVTEDDLIRLDHQFAEARASGETERFAEFLSDDVVGLGVDGSIAGGRNAVLAEWKSILGDPSTQLSWEPLGATLSGAGEMGFIYGEWRTTRESGDGSELLGTGRFVTIWRLEADGVWRVALEARNADETPRAERSF
jgi:ketosteroid isomerase-like protein